MKARVEGSEDTGYIPQGPMDQALLAVLGDEMAPMRPSRPEAFQYMVHMGVNQPLHSSLSVGSRGELLLELAGIKTAIRTWHSKQPDEVLREASAYSARLTELWTELRLVEAYDRTYQQMRTMQVQPVLDEIGRQMEMTKSKIAMLRQDLDMTL